MASRSAALSDVLTPDYCAQFEAHCGSTPDAHSAVQAWQKGHLSASYASNADFEAVDAFIRSNPPQWQPISTSATGGSPAEQLARVCAELYVTLRSGFEVLPRGTPVPVPTRTPNYSFKGEKAKVKAEIDRLVAAGHLITWAEAQQRFPCLRSLAAPDHVLALGVVIKGEGSTHKVRIIVDASRGVAVDSALEQFAQSVNEQMASLDHIPPTRLGSVHQAARGMHRFSWSFKADARDAFLQTKICDDSHRLVGIEFNGITYVYDSCCFGLANMPSQQQRLATIFSRIVMRRWAAAGFDVGPRPGPDQRQQWPEVNDGRCHLIVYLDDWLATGFLTKADCEQAYGIFIATADELGLVLQMEPHKTCPPTQTLDFLGVIFCSRSMSLSLSKSRVAKMVSDLQRLQNAASVTVKELQRLVGVLQWSTVVFATCRPYLRQMLDVLKSVGPRPARGRHINLSAEARADIRMWLRILSVLKLNNRPIASVPLHYTTCRVELYTDASFTAGGYFFGGRWRMWRWPAAWRTERIGFFSKDDSIAICELEALACLVAVRDLAPLAGVAQHRVVMHIDNLPLVRMISKLTTPSAACLVIIKELMWWFVAYGIDAAPVHIRSEDNEASDALTRTGEMSVRELHAILRRWTRSHPDATGWLPRAPLRPDLLQHMESCDYQAPGRQFQALTGSCQCQFGFT